MTNDLAQTVVRARTGGLQDFADLVHQFQDMTVAYAYAYLRDFHLAEDASQEAWLRAWVELPRLRQPAAFAGWLRQVTLACCSRLVRGHRLSCVPLDLAQDIAGAGPAADARLIDDERDRCVRAAVDQLPEHQRDVVLLYYMSQCTQAEVATFLGVAETTVKKRLYDARQRLKEGEIEMVHEQMRGKVPSSDATYGRRVLEGIRAAQTRTTGWSSLICCLQPMLSAAGIEVSVPRLAGIFGHAFSFYMRREPGNLWQDENIDWWLFWESLDLVGCRFGEVQAIGTKAGPEKVQQAKETTWPAVRASIDRGVPAMAWNPMTMEQKERGMGAYEWALLTGYDADKRTYTVRHKNQPLPYEVPFDGFGHTDAVQWFAVMWPTETVPVDDEEVTRRSLRQALEYAHGRRYVPREACCPVDALGLGAYDLWAQRLEEGMAADEARTQAGLLGWARHQAAAFCREMASSAREQAALLQAAAHYEAESGTLSQLHAVCEDSALSRDQRAVAVGLLREATAAERAAVAAIEAAL
jgi:RNA polymerase sigma factor (sigma-70 family)